MWSLLILVFLLSDDDFTLIETNLNEEKRKGTENRNSR